MERGSVDSFKLNEGMERYRGSEVSDRVCDSTLDKRNRKADAGGSRLALNFQVRS